LCGPSHKPEQGSGYFRSGSAPSSVYLDGRKEKLVRPRVRHRSVDETVEVTLKSWSAAKDPKEWEEAMHRAILCGVSCRGIADLDPKALKGSSKSNLSRLWQRKAAGLVEELQQGCLKEFDLLILMIDAVVLCKGLVATVAMGYDIDGNKRILGFQVGNSENQQVCEDLLCRLQRRGLDVSRNRRLLAVLDGSAALQNALLKHFPRTLVQRCLVHKERNLRGYLSMRHWGELTSLFKSLRRAQGEDQAKEVVREIERFLAGKNEQARASYEEAGEDLLTLFTLNVSNTLNTSLLSTNAIENVFKNLRRHIGRVCRWRKETKMADQWIASGLKLAERGFIRMRGADKLPELIKALEQKEQESKAA
jgi:transposase-like protein